MVAEVENLRKTIQVKILCEKPFPMKQIQYDMKVLQSRKNIFLASTDS